MVGVAVATHADELGHPPMILGKHRAGLHGNVLVIGALARDFARIDCTHAHALDGSSLWRGRDGTGGGVGGLHALCAPPFRIVASLDGRTAASNLPMTLLMVRGCVPLPMAAANGRCLRRRLQLFERRGYSSFSA